MNAQFDYVKQLTEMRLTELRREADEYRFAATLAGPKARRIWFRRARATKPLAHPVHRTA